jgi:adenine-specific DNA-methyltransferase
LEAALAQVNKANETITDELRRQFAAKLGEKRKEQGARAITTADERRWILPKGGFKHWTVPFDADPDWPKALVDAVVGYRKAWREKMDEVNECIALNADSTELVDQPEVVKNVLRVSGPFTVEGVNPEELSLGEEGLFDGTPNEFEPSGDYASTDDRLDNVAAYLTEMMRLLKADGLTFTGAKTPKKLARLDPLFSQGTGTELHAEGIWDGVSDDEANNIAITFGPQYGPVTAMQVENAIRAARRYDELVIAGFSFAPEATAAIEDSRHPKLRIHQAQIRPDINPGMAGLLKDTPNSQLFTVFGQPEIDLKETRDGWVVTLEGVDLYDPVNNVVRSSKADKVAAWFLDSDFDGRCFCVTQAFFPSQKAWDKIAKALKTQADPSIFEKLAGTVSLPFPAGTHKRIAVKVIDPRGNEVMAIRRLGK